MISIAFLSIYLALLSQLVAGVAIPIKRSTNNKLTPHLGNLQDIFTFEDSYPLPNLGNLQVHDPNIIEVDNTLYLFKGGIHIPYWKASNIDGPWTQVGTVLSKPSVINKQNNNRPWAPTTVQWKDTFYCFYAISETGSRNSAIGVATTKDIEKGPWTDHPAIINTGTGPLSAIDPFTKTNAIDPSFIVDAKNQPYLVFGSYWDNIYQVALADDLLSVKDKAKPVSTQLVTMPPNAAGQKPQEGSFMTYKDGYYYIWWSQGVCCNLIQNGFPEKGQEYEIRFGRSTSVNGPFVDKQGRKTLEGGGEIIYGSNNGGVYAPGGVGVLPGNSNRADIFYFHYFNSSIGFAEDDTQLGWQYLKYTDGWPSIQNQNTDHKNHVIDFLLPIGDVSVSMDYIL